MIVGNAKEQKRRNVHVLPERTIRFISQSGKRFKRKRTCGILTTALQKTWYTVLYNHQVQSKLGTTQCFQLEIKLKRLARPSYTQTHVWTHTSFCDTCPGDDDSDCTVWLHFSSWRMTCFVLLAVFSAHSRFLSSKTDHRLRERENKQWLPRTIKQVVLNISLHPVRKSCGGWIIWRKIYF